MSATDQQLDELRELLTITGATGIAAALATVRFWKYNEDNRKGIDDRWERESKQAFDTLGQYADCLPPAFHHAVLVLIHEHGLLRDEVVRLRAAQHPPEDTP